MPAMALTVLVVTAVATLSGLDDRGKVTAAPTGPAGPAATAAGSPTSSS